MTKAGKTAVALFFILVIIGLIMLSSAGVVEGQKKFNSASYYPIHQLTSGIIPGLIIFLIFSKISYERWKRWSLPILLLAIALLLAVFVPGLGRGVNGAQRWLDFKIAIVQPSEFLKFALILYCAAWFSSRLREKGERSVVSLIPFLLVLGAAAALLVLQPDFGTLGIVIIIGLAMFFFSGATFKHFFVLILVMLVLLGGLAVAAPYRFNRIKTFLNPHEDKQNTSYHINQALISIGSGGVWGLGYGQSKQKLGALPEPVGDSIFAVIVEEMGLVGGLALTGLFTIYLFALLQIARQTSDSFGRLVVLGIAVWIGGQALINIAAISGIIPLTGVPLPLISFGSSSLVSLMGAMGIIKNISCA